MHQGRLAGRLPGCYQSSANMKGSGHATLWLRVHRPLCLRTSFLRHWPKLPWRHPPSSCVRWLSFWRTARTRWIAWVQSSPLCISVIASKPSRLRLTSSWLARIADRAIQELPAAIHFGWSQEQTVVAIKGSLDRDSPDVAEQSCRVLREPMQTAREVVLIAHPATPEEHVCRLICQSMAP